MGIAKSCPQYHTAGKNIKTILKQKQVGELPKGTEANQEIAIDFAGPFQNAIGEKVLTSINRSFYGMARSKIFTKTEHRKNIEFLKKYITRHGILQRIRTETATIFRSKKFKELCRKRYIEHIECPIRDHKRNGKMEKLFCTINERLRTNKEIVRKRDNSGLSEILFALRMNPSAKKKSCCSKWLTTKEMPKTQQPTHPQEMPKPEEVTTPKETTVPEELANYQYAATTNESTNQSQVQIKRGTNALTALKQKSKRNKTKANSKQEETQKTGTNNRRNSQTQKTKRQYKQNERRVRDMKKNQRK